jgi:lipopolysaccharide export system protein LptA
MMRANLHAITARVRILGLALAMASQAAPALAQSAKPAAKPAQTGPGAPASPGIGLGTFGTNSRDPINIEADHLEVYDKEQKAIYTGNVVVVQGETTMKSAEMVVFYARGQKGGDASAAPAGQQQEGTSLRRVEAFGGVTVASKDQVATGQNGIFDRENNSVILTGNVALSENGNVTKGEKLVYDLTTGKAVIVASPNGRVKSSLVPGSDDKGAPKPSKPGSAAAPAASPKPPARP